MARRVMVIGLDCAPPALVFDRLRPVMPNVASLMRRGAHGPLRSVAPPITVPAWACMVSGRDPGELGLYGFRNRRPGSYALSIADATWLDAPRVWDVAGGAGKRVAVRYVPLTSPPRPVNGTLVGGFLGGGEVFTHPPELGAALEDRFGPHAPDVSEFRTDDTDRLLDELYDTTTQHFRVAKAAWVEERPDLLMMVEMGTDRLHHAFWRHLDPSHPDHDPAHPHVREARDYYAFVDAQVGALLEVTDDDTAVLIVSDHGARTMRGGVCINEWLRQSGWLALKEEPTEPAPLTPSMVDWSRTRAWGEGGYYARVFFNVAGREPEGIVPPEELDAEVRALAAALEALPGPDGRPIATRAARPSELYREVRGVAPELLVFFGDLDYRSLGLVGTGAIHRATDDRGPDGCNHDWDGVFVAAGAGVSARGALEGLSIHDVGPTVLSLLGVPTPSGWLGRSVA
jgi:predicted AlkP superfamily phosphohydrolase/phosphomutase